ncbi:MAG: metalloregulator ArsR/SmtB family transcription factor [Phycisphaerales bacterium]|nr:MAG: metalloregulator ArsR/SmtB family transcription factor [Phycisphaerales bacterium]
MQADAAARLFRALGDTTRQRLLVVLLQHELSVTELVRILGQPQSTISRHLKVLRDAGLVLDRREGTNILYEAAAPSRNGHDPTLRDRLQEWMDSQRLPEQMAQRLKAVLRESREQSESFFSSVAYRWDQLREEHFGASFHLEALTGLLPSDWTVADVGTGTGFLLPVLARTFRSVIAVEMVPEMLSMARSRPDLEDVDNISFRQGSLEKLPVQDESADLALAVLVLHHVESPPAALEELGRIVKPGGRLLIVEQAAHSLSEFHERMQDRWWGFEASELEEEVSEAGFEDVESKPLPARADRPASAAEAPGLFALSARRREPYVSSWSPELD